MFHLCGNAPQHNAKLVVPFGFIWTLISDCTLLTSSFLVFPCVWGIYANQLQPTRIVEKRPGPNPNQPQPQPTPTTSSCHGLSSGTLLWSTANMRPVRPKLRRKWWEDVWFAVTLMVHTDWSWDHESIQGRLDGPGVSGLRTHFALRLRWKASCACKQNSGKSEETAGYDVSALWISSDYWHNLITSYNLMILHVSSSCNLQYLHILFTII